ncbi:MAG: rhodanese-like domain-containing protein [Nitriliruptoraceae bacterium]
MTLPEITPSEVVARGDDVMLLDVREPHEFAAGHIDGAVLIPLSQLAARQEELATDRDIVCVCRSGNRSGMVTEALARAGYDVLNLDGGMLAWAEAHLPFVADDGSPGRIA